ncbi:hypothetical protein YE105_C2509 [Yersinia enterocolitica subsp. palearctica 105.5R(r)]|nr:hypothetical protein YE105_C2509 [Yersinia enterocolitica subsp. palearctica 105.5R(r)]
MLTASPACWPMSCLDSELWPYQLGNRANKTALIVTYSINE